MKETLKIKKSAVNRAQETFRKIANKMKTDPMKLTFVGIHNRRTDYTKFNKAVFKKASLGKSYFVNAMESFRYIMH